MVGNKIREIRIKNKLTLDEASTKAGISRTLLWMIEGGRHSPNLSTKMKIAVALNTTVSNLEDRHEDYIGYALKKIEENALEYQHKKPTLRMLVKEVGEVASCLAGTHEHPIEYELTEIGGIVINWLARIYGNWEICE